MMVLQAFESAELRLAQYYVDRLRVATDAVNRGRSELVYGLDLFDQEWAQIQRWQERSAQYCMVSPEWARLCVEFPIAGSTLLAIRHTPAERLAWWEAALHAARQIEDAHAERVVLASLAAAYSGLGKLKQADESARELLLLARQANDKLHMGKAYYILGTIYEDTGQHAAALRHYNRSLKLFQTLQLHVDRGRALLGLGSVATLEGRFADAYGYFLDYLEIAESSGREADLITALMAVSEVLRMLKRFEEAEKYLQRSIERCRSLSNQWGLGLSLIAMGICSTEQGKLESARAYLEDGVQITRKFSAQRDLINGLWGLGSVIYRQGYPADALPILHEALELSHAMGLPYMAGYIQRRLASVHLALDRRREAKAALREALNTAHSLGATPEIIMALTVAAVYAYTLGHVNDAGLWAGFLSDQPDIDLIEFQALCAMLESALPAETYKRLLSQGKNLSLETVLTNALTLIEIDDVQGKRESTP